MKNMSLTEFAEITASKEPVPGGGSMAALCGGLSAALVEMVSNLTIGKKKYTEVEGKMTITAGEAKVLREALLDDIEKDSDAFTQVMDAFKMSKDTDEEKEIRAMAIQKGLKNAALVPMDVATKAYKVMELSTSVVRFGNKNAVTDGMVSAMMARTAVLSALLNVKINLGSIKDEQFVNMMSEKIDLLKTRTKIKESLISCSNALKSAPRKSLR